MPGGLRGQEGVRNHRGLVRPRSHAPLPKRWSLRPAAPSPWTRWRRGGAGRGAGRSRSTAGSSTSSGPLARARPRCPHRRPASPSSIIGNPNVEEVPGSQKPMWFDTHRQERAAKKRSGFNATPPPATLVIESHPSPPPPPHLSRAQEWQGTKGKAWGPLLNSGGGGGSRLGEPHELGGNSLFGSP